MLLLSLAIRHIEGEVDLPESKSSRFVALRKSYNFCSVMQSGQMANLLQSDHLLDSTAHLPYNLNKFKTTKVEWQIAHCLLHKLMKPGESFILGALLS